MKTSTESVPPLWLLGHMYCVLQTKALLA